MLYVLNVIVVFVTDVSRTEGKIFRCLYKILSLGKLYFRECFSLYAV